MRLIIAGSRSITLSPDHIDTHVAAWEKEHKADVTQVVCGMAKGIDTCGARWALEYGVHLVEFPADWDKHGRAAGPIRNRQMAANADGLLLIWDGRSRGSASMLSIAREYGLKVTEIIAKPEGRP